jgi:predicted nucleic acid-binding protein
LILVDSSAWIDYFNGVPSPEASILEGLLGLEELAIGDLIVAEVLQGFQNERDFKQAKELLESLTVIDLCGQELAIEAAKNFRILRRLGVTVRKTIDTIIATRCIVDGHTLLHRDRDFDFFAKYLGLDVIAP